jgi:glycerophosphoryl diester phosphodiesterase
VYLDIKGGPEAVVKFFKHRPHDNITFCSFNRQFLRMLPSDMKKGTTFEMVPGGVYEYDMLTEGMNAVLVHWSCLNHEFVEYCQGQGDRGAHLYPQDVHGPETHLSISGGWVNH